MLVSQQVAAKMKKHNPSAYVGSTNTADKAQADDEQHLMSMVQSAVSKHFATLPTQPNLIRRPVEKSVFSIWVDLLLCRSIQLLVLSYAEMFVYMYLSQLMSTFTNYLKVHHPLDGFFIP